MPITVVCPVCRQHARVSRKAAGHHVRCPQCGAGFVAPAAPPAPAAAPSPIRFACPTCGAVMEAPARHVGQKVNCAKCGQRLLIPPPPGSTVLARPLPPAETPPTHWPTPQPPAGAPGCWPPPSPSPGEEAASSPQSFPPVPLYVDGDAHSSGGANKNWGGGSAFLGLAAATIVLVVATLVVVTLWAGGSFSTPTSGRQARQEASRPRLDRPVQPDRPNPVEAQPRPQPSDNAPSGRPVPGGSQPVLEKTSLPPTPAQPILAQPWRMKPGLFKTVEAIDRTYSLQVPHDWIVRSADLLENGLSVWSPHGERLFINSRSVPGDQQTFLFQVQGKQLMRQRLGQQGLSREEVELLGRQVSQFLSPADVVKVYWPRIAAPLVQNMQITSIQDLPPGLLKLVQQLTGGTGAVLRYRYTFKGQQAGMLLREQFPPALFGPNEVDIEGKASIGTTPDPFAGVQMPGGHNWTLAASGVEGPAEVFRKHQVLYAVIFLSARVRAEAAAQLVNEQVEAIRGIGQIFLKAGEDMQRQRDAMADFFLDVMGDQVPYYSERENRIYTIPAAEKEEAERQGRSVEGPGGEVLRPATVDDIQRTKPSLVPND